MGVANIEKNIYDRVITQLKGINGSGNYNFNILDYQIHENYIMPSEANTAKGKPVICIGEQRLGPASRVRRQEFEIPYILDIWGYTHKSKDAMDELNELISDLRIALAGDEDLNDLVTEFSFEASSGIDNATNKGVVQFRITAIEHYDTGA